MVEYSILIRSSSGFCPCIEFITLKTCVTVPLLLGGTDVLLARLDFLPQHTQARLMEAAALRLHADRGLHTQAARLLLATAVCGPYLAELSLPPSVWSEPRRPWAASRG